MKSTLALATFVLCATVTALAADQTWSGQISDSMCGAKHGMAKMTDSECTAGCVKSGSKYVFVSKGKVYQISNQADPDLVAHAGHTVMLTGEMKGDTIHVSKIAMPAKGGKAPRS